MTEVELKAHVDDREGLKKKLDAFAHFEHSVSRDDRYWGMEGVKHKKIRVRHEKYDDGRQSVLLTYKKKEKRLENGVPIEVNDERECEMTDSLPLESFLEDHGFNILVKKHKDVMDWTKEVPSHGVIPSGLFATFELCTVPPLGDFLEIEVLSPSDDDKLVAQLRELLEQYLRDLGIPKEKIEGRYYSDMLKDVKNRG